MLGFVGGIELPPIKAAYEGWVNGARAVNPKVQSREIYLNSFDDAAAGPGGGAGADPRRRRHVPPQRGRRGAGAVPGGQGDRPGVYVFGANADQTSLAPERVVGSADHRPAPRLSAGGAAR